MFTLASCNAGVLTPAAPCTDPGCLWGSSGAASCCRRKFTGIVFVDRLCSSCPWRHIILTSYSVPQTSHWCWNLYSDLGGRTWAVKFWAWRGTSLYCYLYHFEHLENARTNPVKDTYPFFLLSIIKAFPIWGLDLTHNSSKPTDKWRNVQQWCGTGRNICMGQGKKMGQGEHI